MSRTRKILFSFLGLLGVGYAETVLCKDRLLPECVIDTNKHPDNIRNEYVVQPQLDQSYVHQLSGTFAFTVLSANAYLPDGFSGFPSEFIPNSFQGGNDKMNEGIIK